MIDHVPLQDLLPSDLTQFWRYSGSLTTPPCFESVVWTVFKKPVELSHDQVNVFIPNLLTFHVYHFPTWGRYCDTVKNKKDLSSPKSWDSEMPNRVQQLKDYPRFTALCKPNPFPNLNVPLKDLLFVISYNKLPHCLICEITANKKFR